MQAAKNPLKLLTVFHHPFTLWWSGRNTQVCKLSVWLNALVQHKSWYSLSSGDQCRVNWLLNAIFRVAPAVTELGSDRLKSRTGSLDLAFAYAQLCLWNKLLLRTGAELGKDEHSVYTGAHRDGTWNHLRAEKGIELRDRQASFGVPITQHNHPATLPKSLWSHVITGIYSVWRNFVWSC